MSPIAGIQYLLEHYTLVLFMTLNFQLEFETASQPGFIHMDSYPDLRNESSYAKH